MPARFFFLYVSNWIVTTCLARVVKRTSLPLAASNSLSWIVYRRPRRRRPPVRRVRAILLTLRQWGHSMV